MPGKNARTETKTLPNYAETHHRLSEVLRHPDVTLWLYPYIAGRASERFSANGLAVVFIEAMSSYQRKGQHTTYSPDQLISLVPKWMEAIFPCSASDDFAKRAAVVFMSHMEQMHA